MTEFDFDSLSLEIAIAARKREMMQQASSDLTMTEALAKIEQEDNEKPVNRIMLLNHHRIIQEQLDRLEQRVACIMDLLIEIKESNCD